MRKLLLLDQQEAQYWREALAKERQKEEVFDSSVQLGLYDVTLGAIVSSGKSPLDENALHADALFLRSITILKFLNANVHYTEQERKILSRWLQKCGHEATKAAFSKLQGK